MTGEETVADRVRRVLERVARAAGRAGRAPGSVRLVAVSKTQPVELVLAAGAAGLSVFGENYVQEAEGKIRALPDAEWHLVGKLQGNKVKKAVSLFSWVQTVDSAGLLADISRRAEAAGKTMQVLIEVNLGGEESKGGTPPDGVSPIIEAASGLRGVRVRGLMAIPPPGGDPEESRPHFARLRKLLEAHRPAGEAGGGMTELSMGMSNDFDVAIEEGATMVRVGTAIFGSRMRRER